MKLQRNNKYSQYLTKRISSVLLSTFLLCGCSNSKEIVDNQTLESITSQSEIVETIETEGKDITEISFDETESLDKKDYYLSFYKIDDDEIKKRLGGLSIKNPDAVWSNNYIKTLVIKDNKNQFKVLQVYDLMSSDFKYIEVYDLATEELLFKTTHSSNDHYNSNERIIGIYLDKAVDKIPYLQDKELVAYGSILYQQTYLNDFIGEFSKRDGVDYKLDVGSILYEIYGKRRIEFVEENVTTKEVLSNYVKYVPFENQVTTKEMGLTINYRPEDKYADCWKLDEEELSSRIESLNIVNENDKFPMSQVESLVLKDREGNYKVLCVIEFSDGDQEIFYDFFTEQYLFSAKLNGVRTYNNDTGRIENIDFSNLVDSIEYFNDKEICYLADAIEMRDFVLTHLQEFSLRDGINYSTPNESLLKILEANGTLEESFYTKHEYANSYVRLPDNIFVTAKELGFDKDKVKSLN